MAARRGQGDVRLAVLKGLPRVPLLIALALLALALGALAWMQLKPRAAMPLPANHDIAAEDFGSGVRVGDTVSAAKQVKPPDRMELQFMTREDLPLHDLYKERPEGKDLLVALYSAELGGAEPVVVELRCYLAPPPDSVARLDGQAAASLDPTAMQGMFGQPFDSSTASDARTHLTFYFADPGDGDMAFKLTSSHEYDGHCFALALERTLAPR